MWAYAHMQKRALQTLMASQQQDRAVILLSPEDSIDNTSDAPAPQSKADHASLTLAQLRSRVEQQSSLIAMMKQRNDETFRELGQCRVQCERETLRSQELQETLAEVTRAKTTLEQRFQTLSYNHEELVKIMEEHKSQNRLLQEENSRLRFKNSQLFSEELQDKEKQLSLLREVEERREERVRVLEGRCEVLEEEVGELEKTARERERLHTEQLAKEQTERKAIEKKLTDAEKRVQTAEKEIVHLRESNRELLLLSSQKDDTIKGKVMEIDGLKLEMAKMQKQKDALTEDLERLSVELARDAQVIKLKEQLQEERKRVEKLQKEFIAYQKHSSDLLHKEQELNTKLRHMSDL